MKNQHGPVCRSKTPSRRFEVSGQNLFLTDPLIGEEAISGLCIGPVLTNEGDTFSDAAPEPRKQESESLAQPLIPEHASRQFTFHPCGERISLHGYLATVLAVTRNIAALVSLLLLQADLL